jgi:hypothetical protein
MMETGMTRLKFTTSKLSTLKLLGATGVLAATLANPAMAQQVISNPGYCAQFYPNANCQNKGPGNPYTGDYQRRTAYRDDGYREGWNNDANNGWRQSRNDDSFIWRDLTAGAVGTAPLRTGNAFAYDDGFHENRSYGRGTFGTGYAHSDYYANAHAGQGWNGIYANNGNNTYAARNGFVCEPGSFVRGEDGLRHRCQ